MDIVINKLHERFQSLKYVNTVFQAIQPQELIKLSDDQLYESAQRIVNKYNEDISDSFPMQLISMRSCLKSSITKLTTVKKLANLLIVENFALAASFPDVCTVLILFLTIPITVATAERSFSKLKLKSYLRSVMNQDRLSALSILSIEHKEANYLRNTLYSIIDVFAEKKVQKMKFLMI